ADMGGSIDELLIERGAVGADRLDLLLELALLFERHFLLRARRIKLLVVLLERICGGKCRRGGCRRWNCRWNLSDRRGRRLGLGKSCPIGSERKRKCQCRAEHKARIGAARPAENHCVQEGRPKPQESNEKQ